MRKFLGFLLVLALALTGLVVSTSPAQAADTGNASPQTGRIVSDEPGTNAPNILNGTVNSVAKVGNTIVVGGTFTQAQNYNTSATVTRNRVLSFDATTGRLNTGFAPNPDNTVFKVLPAADGESVYVAGRFNNAAGRSTPGRIIKLNATTGAVDPNFTAPSITGDIRDLELVGDHLFIAGKFTHINGVAQRALGTVYADTGRRDPYFNAVLAGTHNTRPGAVTNVLQISIDQQNQHLMAVGNFTTVDGQNRHQIAKFDVANLPTNVNTTVHQSLSPWSTNLFTSTCSSAFETYMTDVEYSPNGNFFVVSTTGAYGGSSGSMAGTSGCDVVARFEDDATTGATPATWTAYTGGDSTWTVEVTDNVVYAGGHQRWQNNPAAGDRVGPGAVSREGIAALNTVNGMPYSWNPTRSLGVGVQDMLATSDGLYVGSDTTLIGHTPGNTYHARIAFLPLAGGATLPQLQATSLPVDVYRVASGGSQLVRRSFNGTASGTTANVPTGPGWITSTGAFMVNGVLYQANSDGSLSRMTFNGSTYGAVTPVNAADALANQSEWHNDARTLTSLFYSGGYLYYTKSGTNALYRRGFEVESGVVGQQRFSTTASGINYANVRGAFVASGRLYFASTNGSLSSATWIQTAHSPTGTPAVLGSAGTDWSSRALFPYQGVPGAANQPPVANASVSCDRLMCTFNATASTDPEGGPLSYDWDYGDGTPHGSGATTTHAYATPGDRSVTLTVTDNRGATSTASRTASPSSQADAISFVANNHNNGNRSNHTIAVPSGTQVGDTMLLFFAGNSLTPTYAGPAGWTQVLSDEARSEVGRLWSKTATAADLGASVTVTSRNTNGSTYSVKSDLTLATYRGTGTPPVATAAITTQDVADAVHQTPTVTASDGTSWLVSYWSDKSSSTTGWTPPAGQVQRSEGAGSGSGRVSSLLTDSGQRVAAGTQGGLNATADSAAQGLTMSVLLRGGAGGTPPANSAPTARITNPSCTNLTCTANGSTSSDPDGDSLSYDWNWGDGTAHGTTANPIHTYGSAGARTVTLTVNDGQGHVSTATTTVNPSTAPAAATSFVGAESSQGNRRNHSTSVPSGTQVGDTLVAFFVANTTNPTYDGPTGWTLVETQNGSGVVGRAWTRTATAADLGSRVTVTSSSYAKSDLTVAAYRGVDAGAPITASAARTDNSSGAAHASPTVTAPDSNGWLVTYWADKANDTTGWAAPAGQQVREAPTTSTGSGHVTPLLVDSNGPVAAGTAGGLTATANATSSRGVSFSVLLRRD